jgi:predicted dehydrogenase
VTVGVAIVGCGLVGAKRAAAIPSGAELVAVFDPDVTRANAVASSVPSWRRGAVEIATSARAAIEHPDASLVIVATPHRSLPELACLALESGRHVLVEKPGAADLAGALSIADAATSSGGHARVGFNHRFHPSLREARRLIGRVSSDGFDELGAYGVPMFVRARYGHGGRLGYEREWRADAAVSGGGELIDQGIHLIDLTRFLVGDVTLSCSHLRTAFWPMGVEDNAFIALECASGAFAWLHASWTEWKNLFSLEIMLERAKIEISGLGGSYGVETLTLFEMLPEMGPPIESSRSWDGEDDSWARELADVVAVIADDVADDAAHAAGGASIHDAVAALRIVDAAYTAHRKAS